MTADDDKRDKSKESAIKSVIAQRGVVAVGSALSKYRIGEQAVPEKRLPFPSLRSGSLVRCELRKEITLAAGSRITNIYMPLCTLCWLTACEPAAATASGQLIERVAPSSANGPGLLADFFLIWINNDKRNNSALKFYTYYILQPFRAKGFQLPAVINENETR